jgi:hypothetical protein
MLLFGGENMILCILATSKRFEPYINIISYNIRKHEKNLKEIIIINSLENNELKKEIIKAFENLSNGIYKSSTDSEKDSTFNEEPAKLFYRKCYNLLKESNGIKLNQIDKYDEDFYNEVVNLNKKNKIIFDVTTLEKYYLLNLISYSIIEKINNIFIFKYENNYKQSHDINDLVHNLSEINYKYVDIISLEMRQHIKNYYDKLDRKIKLSYKYLYFVILMFLIIIILNIFIKNDFVNYLNYISTILGIVSTLMGFIPLKKGL